MTLNDVTSSESAGMAKNFEKSAPGKNFSLYSLEERLRATYEDMHAAEQTSQASGDAHALIATVYNTLRGMLNETITIESPAGFADDLEQTASLAREVATALLERRRP